MKMAAWERGIQVLFKRGKLFGRTSHNLHFVLTHSRRRGESSSCALRTLSELQWIQWRGSTEATSMEVFDDMAACNGNSCEVCHVPASKLGNRSPSRGVRLPHLPLKALVLQLELTCLRCSRCIRDHKHFDNAMPLLQSLAMLPF